jgi:hypothetical protein
MTNVVVVCMMVMVLVAMGQLIKVHRSIERRTRRRRFRW